EKLLLLGVKRLEALHVGSQGFRAYDVGYFGLGILPEIGARFEYARPELGGARLQALLAPGEPLGQGGDLLGPRRIHEGSAGDSQQLGGRALFPVEVVGEAVFRAEVRFVGLGIVAIPAPPSP